MEIMGFSRQSGLPVLASTVVKKAADGKYKIRPLGAAPVDYRGLL
jgi:hypothetical protein